MCTAPTLPAQPAWLPAAKYQTAGTYSLHFQHAFTPQQNQAALAHIPAITAGIHAERRFMIQAMNAYTATIAIPLSAGTFGFTAQQYGFTAYKEQKLAIAYGRQLGTKVSIGIQLDYLSRSIPVYGNAATVTAEAGILFHITGNWHAGLHTVNPAGQKIGAAKEPLPAIWAAGIGYEASGSCLLSAEVIKEQTQPLNARVMLEYRIVRPLAIMLGISTTPQLNTAAVDCSWDNLRLRLSASYHSVLGITPGLTIIWQQKRKTAG